jgi:carboxypeptidase C (cathepsin A)
MWFLVIAALTVADAVAPDLVTHLPSYGDVKGVQYSGLLAINATYDKHLFYWFAEAAVGNVPGKTPLLIWMNGGPGASSITGLLAENIGPISAQLNGSSITLKDNPLTWAQTHNVIIIDNPVGAGFSYTKDGGWVTSEEQMRQEFCAGLMGFFRLHPEYERSPIWVTGESYGGKYVPNVAYEIHLQGKLNLQGVIIGNGMFSPRLQYATIADYAYNQGIIDSKVYALAKEKFGNCVRMIELGENSAAFKFCEDVVDWLYGSNETGAGQFYYDLGLSDGSFFDDLTNAMGSWLNSNETRSALHVGDHMWVQSDEKGPVAKGLASDFVNDGSMDVLSKLLHAKKYKVVSYNGVRDGSLCNHVGNSRSLDAISWDGQLRFNEAPTRPFHVKGAVAGYMRGFENLSYFTLLRTGHLVPTVVPEVGLALIDFVLRDHVSRDHADLRSVFV